MRHISCRGKKYSNVQKSVNNIKWEYLVNVGPGGLGASGYEGPSKMLSCPQKFNFFLITGGDFEYSQKL